MDINYFKQKLEAEKVILEKELDNLGVRNIDRENDWHARPSDISPIDTGDEVAERLEEWGERQSAEQSLEARLKSVNKALEFIQEGNYGYCLICQKEIAADRLIANPAAMTCKTHIDEKVK